jgi:phosphatidylserine/phosphatidylglycerophosphate/cardiolipin synthase-like enzyme
MHAWNGDRGRSLARQAVSLRRSGCWVAAILGVGAGRAVKTILRRGDVNVRYGSIRGVRTHQKLLIVNGRFDGDPSSHIVWTGSANWTDGSMRRDEVILRINREPAFDKYVGNWRRTWRRG